MCQTHCTPNFVALMLVECKNSNQYQDKTPPPCRVQLRLRQMTVHVGWGTLIPSDRQGLFATCLIPGILKTVFGINALEGIEHLRGGEAEERRSGELGGGLIGRPCQ